ncbi:hypothetical protein ACFQHW_08795 [Lapidilactobacillus achengensis]|uniref:Uncharacterized protein n=1 Tax=Lapidilactobacillus achengensis TaxID=2486000 RepID=A0ABW1UNV8_9LACO|nr:hypothetical protein [Lapidilactobacillus achengensis]
MTTNHGRKLRGSSSIDHSLPVGVSAQTAVKTFSGWSGEIRGEIAVKLSLAALPLRTRPDFETSRVLCGLAQNSAHSELTPNFAAQAAANLLLSKQPGHLTQRQQFSSKVVRRENTQLPGTWYDIRCKKAFLGA